MLVDLYLNGRTQFVRCGEKKSSVGRVTCSVPQGVALVSYINNVSRVIKFNLFHFYADDLQIYHSSSVLDYDEINMDLQQIH
jgi:hypothetical protein